MTTANIFSVGKNSNVYATLGSGSRNDTKRVAEEAAEIFGAVMNQMSQDLSSMQSEAASVKDSVQETASVSTEMDSPKTQYEYSSKENHIERATESESRVAEEAVTEEVEELTEETMEVLCEKLNLSKEELLSTMQELGISEEELLLPEKLGQLVMELTGETDIFQLLTNSDFQAILQEVTGMEKEAAASLGMDLKEFQAFLKEMNQTADHLVQTEETTNDILAEVSGESNLATEEVPVLDSVEKQSQMEIPQTVDEQKLHQELTTDELEDLGLEQKAEQEKQLHDYSEDQMMTEEDSVAEEMISRKMEETEKNGRRGENQFEGGHQQLNEGTISGHQQAGDITSNVISEESFQTISYSDIDVDDLMQQFVEKTQITVMENKTTMDMQLNPENLGKIYLHISTEEGNIHAQITATNEVVKEALEAQLATLRENLNQAGVKVDSVEISVATHEFEQNLEQNSKQEEEQARMQEENSRSRRNINMNSLEELAGVLSEEEVLVAQMMRDHGNSVDFTA